MMLAVVPLWIMVLCSLFYLASFLKILPISAYSIRFLLLPFSATISCRFVISVRVCDDILDLCGLLIALTSLDAFCWIMSVMVSLMVPMSSSSYSVSIRFLNPSWNLIFLDPIRVASTLDGGRAIIIRSTYNIISNNKLLLFVHRQ